MEKNMILQKLEEAGYQAYVVGGYPRDLYRNVESTDIDICTNAKPQEIVSCLKKYDKILESFGSVWVNGIQITTFRKDISYKGHYPKVVFVDNLKEDLLRRDFVMNTLCLDKNGEYIDYLGARDDIDKKIIRAVGNPDFKIKEDPLRILRAIRFSLVLGFTIADDLKQAMKKYNYLVETVPIKKRKEEKMEILRYASEFEYQQICLDYGLEKWMEE